MTNNRREARYPARIVARVVRRRDNIELITNDVSFRGVFIRTDSPPALRQLVKVELVLPADVVVSGHAMVVHVAGPPAGQPVDATNIPGIGLQFWGAIDRAKEWEKFIHELRQQQKAGTLTANGADKIRRASERFKLALDVTLDGTVLMTRDVSENGFAVRTQTRMPVGVRTNLQLRAGENVMGFDVIVRREIDEPGFRGLGVEIVDMTSDRRAALVKFIRSHAPSEDKIFVPAGDPKLH